MFYSSPRLYFRKSHCFAFCGSLWHKSERIDKRLAISNDIEDVFGPAFIAPSLKQGPSKPPKSDSREDCLLSKLASVPFLCSRGFCLHSTHVRVMRGTRASQCGLKRIGFAFCIVWKRTEFVPERTKYSGTSRCRNAKARDLDELLLMVRLHSLLDSGIFFSTVHVLFSFAAPMELSAVLLSPF